MVFFHFCLKKLCHSTKDTTCRLQTNVGKTTKCVICREAESTNALSLTTNISYQLLLALNYIIGTVSFHSHSNPAMQVL